MPADRGGAPTGFPAGAPTGSPAGFPAGAPPGRTWRRKFADAFRGLARAVRTQSSFAVHLPVAGLVVLLAALLRLPARDWAVILLAIGGVLAAELFNSALEAFARAPGQGRHPRIRDALDIASAAVLVAATTAVGVGLVVFLPRLVELVRAAERG